MNEALFAFEQIVYISLDKDGLIEALSPAAEQYLKGSIRRLQGTSILKLLPKEHPVIVLTERPGSYSLFDQQFKLMNSSFETFDIHKLDTGNGTSILIYPKPAGVKNNIVNEVRGAALQASGMAAMLSHEIRNPLAAIQGASQLLESSVMDDDRELISVIREEASRIGKLVNEFEEVAGDVAPEMEPVNIHHVIDLALRAARAGYAQGFQIQEKYDPSLPEVSAEPDRLQRALTNLLKNSCEAISTRFESPQMHGSLKVQTSYRRGIRRQNEDLPVEITISDNGGGMDKSLMQEIFKPFVTTKSNGTGLGLSMVARTIEEFGGVIEVENTNLGCEFRMLLPIWRQ